MIRVRVPATSANLGSGFDSLGIALDLYNEYEFAEIQDGIIFEGVEEEFADKNNIIFKSMEKTFKKYKYKYSGIFIKVIKQDIPISRGLGSSSSCIVAGITGAMKLMNMPVDKDEIFKLAVEIEGHPDNVCPAIFGGLTAAVMIGDNPYYNKIEVKDDLKFVAIVPDFRLETAKARAVLPKNIKLTDAIFNVSRTALLVSVLVNGKYDLLKTALQDKLHQQYRSQLIKGFNDISEKAIIEGALGFYLSGAGPTMIALVEKNNDGFKKNILNYLKQKEYHYDIYNLKMDFSGVEIF